MQECCASPNNGSASGRYNFRISALSFLQCEREQEGSVDSEMAVVDAQKLFEVSDLSNEKFGSLMPRLSAKKAP